MSKKVNREVAIRNLGKEAHKRVLKNEVMKFRLESHNLERLLSCAYKQNKPAGTLVREWVLEKLNEVEHNVNGISPRSAAINIITDSLAEQGLLKDSQVRRIRNLLTNGAANQLEQNCNKSPRKNEHAA